MQGAPANQLAAMQQYAGAMGMQPGAQAMPQQMMMGPPAAPAAAPAAARPAAPQPPVASRQKKRKFGQERPNAQEKVSTVIPESALYNYLLDMDRLVTDTINRRKADFKEPFPPYHEPVKRVLRITVQALHANQQRPRAPPPAPPPAVGPPSTAAALAAASAAMFAGPRADAAPPPPREPPSWVLQISGALVDPTDQLVRAALGAAAAAAARGDPSSAALVLQAQQLAAQHAAQQAAQAASGATGRAALSACVRRVEVALDPALYPGEAGRVVWDKGSHSGPPREAIEVRRVGGRSCRATILIHPDYQPERYVLPPKLAEVLGMMGHETRSRVMVALYGFIKSRRLQDPQEPINVNLTPDLERVFGTPSIKLSELGTRLSALLVPVPPVRIDYDIRLDGPSPCELQLLDVDFFTPSALPHQMAAVLQSYYKEREIESMDARLAALTRRLNEARRRRALLLGFAHNPIDVSHALLASQARDLRQARANSGRDFELERRSDVFRQRWVEDAVVNYLHKRNGLPML